MFSSKNTVQSSFNLTSSILCSGLGSFVMPGHMSDAFAATPVTIDDNAIATYFWLTQPETEPDQQPNKTG